VRGRHPSSLDGRGALLKSHGRGVFFSEKKKIMMRTKGMDLQVRRRGTEQCPTTTARVAKHPVFL